MLSSSIAEHEAGLLSKKATLQRETRLLQSDEEICGQLDDVREGLEAKLAKLVEAEEENEATSLASLRGKIDSTEASLSRFLASLIQTSNSLYSDRDSEKREQLRHLIDVSPALLRRRPPLTLSLLCRDSSTPHGTLQATRGCMSVISICPRLSPFSFVPTWLLSIHGTLATYAWLTFTDSRVPWAGEYVLYYT